jgi:hypothetical protein
LLSLLFLLAHQDAASLLVRVAKMQYGFTGMGAGLAQGLQLALLFGQLRE